MGVGVGKIKHGLGRHKLYDVWRQMIIRCEDPKYKGYKNWGGRGIRVCKSWHQPLVFVKWAMENGWRPGLSIERIDNEGNYKPSNCTFIPRGEQSRNRRNCIWIEAFGKKQILSDWSKETQINFVTIKSRLKMGWTIEEALSIRAQVGGWIHRTAFRRKDMVTRGV